MISRVLLVGLALFAVLAVASPCLAASDSTGAAPGRGGIGGLIGGSFMLVDADYSKGALPRFDFAGHWRYVFSRSFRMQVSPGFTWSGYAQEEPIPFTDPRYPADQTKHNMLTLIVPISGQIQYTRHRGPWVYHAGLGPGVYRVWVENRRKVLKDPTTFAVHRGTYPGGTAEIGAERFFKALPSTSVEVQTVFHFIFAQWDEQFPNGFNSNLGNLGLR